MRAMKHVYRTYHTAEMSPQHAHEMGQFAYVWRGSGLLQIENRTWLLPPRHGFWIPANCRHSFSCLRASVMTFLFFENGPDICLPDSATLVAVDSLCIELLSALRELDRVVEGESAEKERLFSVLRDRVARLPGRREIVADVLDPRLSPIVAAVFDEPTRNHTLAGWAHAVGATERTLVRLFRQTFGMTFVEWRQRILMDEALRRLQAGESVSVVALDLGYSTPSAFSHAFHEATGVPPSRFDLTVSTKESRDKHLPAYAAIEKSLHVNHTPPRSFKRAPPRRRKTDLHSKALDR
jgi:AraC-like DNA-binding protein